MTELFLYCTLALLMLVAAIWLLVHSGPSRQVGERQGEGPSAYFPVHCRYYPQMRQVFSREDTAFLAGRGSPMLLRRWNRERRLAALLYLQSLREDFANLNRLARVLARYSERLEAGQQARVLWLNVRFQMMWQLALAQIALGLPAGPELLRITRLVGNLGSQLEKLALRMEEPAGALTP